MNLEIVFLLSFITIMAFVSGAAFAKSNKLLVKTIVLFGLLYWAFQTYQFFIEVLRR